MKKHEEETTFFQSAIEMGLAQLGHCIEDQCSECDVQLRLSFLVSCVAKMSFLHMWGYIFSFSRGRNCKFFYIYEYVKLRKKHGLLTKIIAKCHFTHVKVHVLAMENCRFMIQIF